MGGGHPARLLDTGELAGETPTPHKPMDHKPRSGSSIMLNGRHFVLLGIVACAGLFSVHDGQKQIDLCYDIAALEKNLRDVRSEIELCKIKHQALQSPKAVMSRVAELKLKVVPGPAPIVTATQR